MALISNEYQRHEWWWRFYRAAYRGGIDWYLPEIRGNYLGRPLTQTTTRTSRSSGDTVYSAEYSFLERFEKETDRDWVQRQAMSYYENFPAHVINTYTSHVLAKPITQEGPPQFKLWADDPMGTGAKKAIRLLRQQAITMAQVYGHCFSVTDVPPVPEGESVRTEADERRLGLRPYTYLLSPLDVVKYRVDGQGGLRWARTRQWTVQDPDDPYGTDIPEESYRMWTKTETWVEKTSNRDQRGRFASTMSAEEVPGSRRYHGLGKVPIDVLYSETDPEGGFLGLSRIRDIAFLAREIYNLISLQQVSLYHNTYPFMFVPDKGNRLGGEMKLGARQMIPFDPEGGGVPTLLAPPLDGARMLGERIQELVDEIRALAGLSRGRGEQSIAARSADALLVENQDKGARLRTLAANAEEWEHSLGDTVMRWTTKRPAAPGEITVAYPTDFNIQAFLDELDEALKLKELEIPTKAMVAKKEAIVRRLFGDRSSADVDEMLRVEEDVADRPTLTLAPADAAVVVLVKEARASMGLGLFGDERDNMSLSEYRAKVEGGGGGDAPGMEPPAVPPAPAPDEPDEPEQPTEPDDTEDDTEEPTEAAGGS